jgi:signal transduction histidine kinase/DNA-binding response OmpR family regulator
MNFPILSVAVRYEHDVVAARQRAREIAALLGFEPQEQTRIATAVSEIARNAFTYAGGGTVEFAVEGRTAPQIFVVRVSDRGPGIADLSRIMAGEYRSRTGMGLGILGARRLMDRFDVESTSGRGTLVTLRKLFARGTPLVEARRLAAIVDELARRQPRSAVEEVQQQNQELLRALGELRARQEELVRLNGELEDTNRGVVALYAELDEKADHLRRADALKSRFLSNMSHEFRTPVNSILALSRLLLDRSDGDLTEEQARQVAFVRKAAEDLSELVNDLLDLAKVEAGRIEIRPVAFHVEDLFAALRGMLRPLLLNESVRLVFDEPADVPTLFTDEGKVSQILRNFISNALKFTEQGEVRVSATLAADRGAVVLAVADTGMGIAPADHERIFEEFTQVESPVQKRVRGTGLGLPLCRKLAALLGGRVELESAPGVGSTFSAIIPVVYAPPTPAPASEARPAWQADPRRTAVLVVEDSFETVLLYEKYLKGSPFQMVPARTVAEAREALVKVGPKAVVLDIMLRGEDAWAFLAAIKGTEATRLLPVLVVTTVEDQAKGMALGADAYALKPIDREWLLENLARLTREPRGRRVLLIDDDETARYVVKQQLPETVRVLEAGNGLDGLVRARAEVPDAIVLDLVMPGIGGEEVLEQLKGDPATRDIPVLIVTSKALDAEARAAIEPKVVAIVPKDADAGALRRALASAGVG